MNNRYPFDLKTYNRRNQGWLLACWLVSLLLDVILCIQFFSFDGRSEADHYGRIAMLFLLLMNQSLLKGISTWVFLRRRKARKNGLIEFQDECILHLDRVELLSRLQVILRLGHVEDPQKTQYHIYDHYLVRQVDRLSKDRRGNLVIEGVIEQSLINEFLEISSEFDWQGPATQIIIRHTIPAYYENMAEIEKRILSIQRDPDKA